VGSFELLPMGGLRTFRRLISAPHNPLILLMSIRTAKILIYAHAASKNSKIALLHSQPL
jgi:hypothetical protein